jgi:hypothetical protein
MGEETLVVIPIGIYILLVFQHINSILQFFLPLTSMASDPYLKKVRRFFSRLLFSHGIDPSLPMMILYFWMFVQENGCVNLFECMSAFNKRHILVMIAFIRHYVDVLIHLESSDSNTSSPPRKGVIELISTSIMSATRPWEIFLTILRSVN